MLFRSVKEMESRGASKEELVALLGKGRAKKGMHEGDVEEGELEIGQVSGLIDTVPSVSDIIKNLLHIKVILVLTFISIIKTMIKYISFTLYVKSMYLRVGSY